jgi:hypothetical protein
MPWSESVFMYCMSTSLVCGFFYWLFWNFWTDLPVPGLFVCFLIYLSYFLPLSFPLSSRFLQLFILTLHLKISVCNH